MKKQKLKTESINEYLNRGGTINRLKSKPTINEVHMVGSTKSRLFGPKSAEDFRDGQSPNLRWTDHTYERDSRKRTRQRDRRMAKWYDQRGIKRFYEKD